MFFQSVLKIQKSRTMFFIDFVFDFDFLRPSPPLQKWAKNPKSQKNKIFKKICFKHKAVGVVCVWHVACCQTWKNPLEKTPTKYKNNFQKIGHAIKIAKKMQKKLQKIFLLAKPSSGLGLARAWPGQARTRKKHKNHYPRFGAPLFAPPVGRRASPFALLPERFSATTPWRPLRGGRLRRRENSFPFFSFFLFFFLSSSFFSFLLLSFFPLLIFFPLFPFFLFLLLFFFLLKV